MQANLETLDNLQRKLNIAVPMAEIEGEVESRLKKLSRTVKMAGFRPGKVPFKVVAQQYGMQVRQEVLGDTLQKTFGDAVREQNLRVAGYPKFDAAPPADGASDFQYSATFEVYPEVMVGDVAKSTVTRPTLEVTQADVDKTLEIMRKQRVSYEAAERAAENGDRVTMDYRGTIDGVEFAGGAAQGQSVVLGEGRFLPEFEKQLPGMKAGEQKSFELKFPDDYAGKEVAGKTAVFEVTVKEVAVPKLPPVDAEFAKSLGVEDGDQAKMRSEIRGNLEREVKARLKARVKEQVMDALLAVTSIDVPKALVEMEIERLQGSARQDLAARGIPVREDMPLPVDMFEKQAQRRVTLGLILAEVVRAHGLNAKPEQVRAAVEEQAQSYEHPQEVVKWFYQSQDRLRDIEGMVLEENVVNWALATAKVEDQGVSFDELMGNPK
ncbi:MAG: trigger factor [Betaproteobacteria bacterium]|jgi:trigger factor|nr:trigger factor [Betaproteobacteria bacterium]MDH5342838.1 trigger factor [Betaproteobacteria bacterium]